MDDWITKQEVEDYARSNVPTARDRLMAEKYVDFDSINDTLDFESMMDDYYWMKQNTPLEIRAVDDNFRNNAVPVDGGNKWLKKIADVGGNVASDFLLGTRNKGYANQVPSDYDVQGWLNYDPYADYDEDDGNDGSSIAGTIAMLGAYNIPVVGQGLFIKDVADNVYDSLKEGELPGILNLYWGGKSMGMAARNFKIGFERGKARKAAEKARNKNILDYTVEEMPKYRLMDKEGNELLRNNDKFLDRKWR